jgi:uncharacterized protein (TIGR02246 family)
MRVLTLMVISLLVVWPSQSQLADNEEEAIRAMWHLFEKYYDDSDVDGIASLYAPDSDRFNNDGQRAEGRSDIRAVYAEIIANRALGPPMKKGYHANISVRFLRPDIAIVDGVSNRTLGVTGYFTLVVTKEDGDWLIAAGRPRGSVRE